TLEAEGVGELPTTGLKLWLKPETLVQSSAGLGRWTDSSGLNNHATQSTVANRPLVVADAFNGQPVVRFNGSSSNLNLPYFLSGQTSVEMFVVVKADNATPGASARLFSYFGVSAAATN